MLFMATTKCNGKPNGLETSLLLHCVGEEAKEVGSIFSFSLDTDSMKFDKVIKKFEACSAPRKDVTYSCFKFLHTSRTLAKYLGMTLILID